MSNLQVIEELCTNNELLCGIVRRLSRKLEELQALSEMDKQDIQAACDGYAKIIGADELLDDC